MGESISSMESFHLDHNDSTHFLLLISLKTHRGETLVEDHRSAVRNVNIQSGVYN